jgi:plastocyanin
LNALLAAAILAIASAASPIAPGSLHPGFVVHIKDFKYAPTPLKIHVGDTVRFINDDDEPHTVTATDKSFDSGGARHERRLDAHVHEARHLFVFLRTAPVHEGDRDRHRRHWGPAPQMARSDFGAIVHESAWSATHPATWGAL